MLRATVPRSVLYRVNYNLGSSWAGKPMTGYMTPYRHWMWKQNELWRNVHESQFEHLRKLYKRQWLESFRVNADEYIHKYTITKAAQLAQWEHEMHAQEAKRKENLQTAQGRQVLKSKHLDLLREYHERHFFYWYERASERLQYMTHIKYVSRDKIDAHIEKELDKYVAGKPEGYPLNFAGQMPVLEDADGNVVQVPAGMLQQHMAEHQSSTATSYEVPRAEGDDLLRTIVSGIQETELPLEISDAFKVTIDDIAKQEDATSEEAKIARSMEESDDERAISRQKYISRGQTGSKSVYRKVKLSDDGSVVPPPADTTKPLKKKKKVDEQHRKSAEFDAFLAKQRHRVKDDPAGAETKIGDVTQGKKGKIRDKVVLPTVEEIMAIPEMAAQSLGKAPKASKFLEDRYNLKKKKDDDNL